MSNLLWDIFFYDEVKYHDLFLIFLWYPSHQPFHTGLSTVSLWVISEIIEKKGSLVDLYSKYNIEYQSIANKPIHDIPCGNHIGPHKQ